MRSALHACVSVALLALLTSPAFAGKKKIDGLVFRPAQPVGTCANWPFLVSQEPDPFFKGLIRTKTHGTEQFRRGKDVVEKFPDELIVTVRFSQNAVPSLCPINFGLDPKTIKFRAEWRAGPRNVNAKGTVVQAELQDQGPWCEDTCGGLWEYELRIDAEGVPLQDFLVIRVDASDGAKLVEYVGALGPAAEMPAIALSP
jgi:hypothetical protein